LNQTKVFSLAARAAAAISLASASVPAIGFSQETGLPAAIAARAPGACM